MTQSYVSTSHARFGERDDQAARLRELVSSLGSARPKDVATRPQRRVPIIAVASGKGGVGKTSTCVNLSIALARHNRRVCLLDADLGCANADVLCGMMPTSRLDEAAPGGSARSLRDLLVTAPGGFSLIPGSVGFGHAGELGADDRKSLVTGLGALGNDHDAIIIDTSAGLGDAVTGFLQASDLGLIVMTPEPTSVADAYALVKVLATHDQSSIPRLGLVINQAQSEKEAASVYGRMAGVCERFLGIRVPMVGYVRYDKRVSKAVRERTPYMLASPKGRASKDMLRLGRSMIEFASIEPWSDGVPY